MNDNNMQTMAVPGQGAQPMQPVNGAMPQMQPVIGLNGQPLVGPNGQPLVQSAPVVQMQKGGASSLIKTIAIIVLSLVAVTFIGLFIWKQMEYSAISEGENERTAAAVDKARYEQKEEDLAQFAEDEKYPLRDFAGPADYGQLSFKYPKTWSVYVAKDASNGGDYEAYFNPLVVEEVSDDTINALRLAIKNKTFEDVTAEYQRAMDRKDSGLSVESVEVNGITMNRYTGKIPSTERSGVIVIFKIRDKTAILQTDAEAFINDFNALVNTINFNA